MKPPTKPPPPPTPPNRARKDVNYTPSAPMQSAPPASVRGGAGALRSKPPLPSARTQAEAPQQEEPYDLVEDMATPTRTPNLTPSVQQLPFAQTQPPPQQQQYQQPQYRQTPAPQQYVTGPMQVLQQSQIPQQGPPSQRSFDPPPSQRSFDPPPSQRNFGPPNQGMSAASSGRVRQGTPMDTPSYSGQGPVPQQHITGPQLPVHRPNTGSYPNVGSRPDAGPPISRPMGDAAPDPGVPLGYVVASAFFLAIAVVGFGLYLAFEVISL